MGSTINYQVVDNIDASIYWKDLSGKYLGCNKYMARMIGKKRNQIIGFTDFSLIDKNQAERIKENDILVINNNKKYELEETIIDSDKNKRIFLSSKSPLLDENNKIIGIIGVSIDITHHKKLINEFERTETSLNEYSSIKNRFLKNINHEARIPLGSVLSISESLKNDWHSFSDKMKLENVELIFKEISRLSKFVLDTFDTSDFSKNGIKLQLKKCNFSKFLKETVTRYQKSFCDTQITIEVNHFDDYFFAFDTILISRVIENIMMNAVEYSPKAKSIKITLYKTNLKNTEIPAVHCCISDEGVGVPEDELNLIFSPFTESSRTASQACGVGLGLSICKEIIEAHSGYIWAENNSITPGVTFNFTIPTNLLSLSSDFVISDAEAEKKSSNIVRRQLSRKLSNIEKKPFALIGISPFNSYFSTEKILEICEWIHNEYDDFAIFIPNEISKYTFEALGYTEARANRKIKKQDNYTINKINKALAYFYAKYPEKQNIKSHTISELRQYESYEDLYSVYSNMFLNNKEFRNNCLEVTEWVLLNSNTTNSVIEDYQKNIAVQYFLFELPIMTHATNILKIDACDFVYHSIPNFLKHLYLGKELVSPKQRFLVLS